jgi:hypothetical protein
MVICMHTLRPPGSVPLNRGVLSTNRSNEQSIASNDHWDATGWFVGVLGASCWFVLSAVALAWRGQLALACVSCASWAIAIGASVWLWRLRDRIAVFPARIVLFIVLSLVMPLVWYTSWDTPTDTIMPSLYWIRGVRGIAASSIFPLITICLLVGKCYSFAKPFSERQMTKR